MGPEEKIEDEILELINYGLKIFMVGNTVGGINDELDDLKSEKVIERFKIERFKDYTLTDFLTLYKIKLLAENKIISKEQASGLIKLFKEKIKVERVINAEVEKEMSNSNYKSKQKVLLGFVKDKIDKEIEKTNIPIGDIKLESILLDMISKQDYSSIPKAEEIDEKLKSLKYE